MNPTGHTTADLAFTGLLLVLHLAALASLGYLLGCYAGRRKFDAAIAAAKRETEEAKAYRNGMHVRNFREMKEWEERAVKAESERDVCREMIDDNEETFGKINEVLDQFRIVVHDTYAEAIKEEIQRLRGVEVEHATQAAALAESRAQAARWMGHAMEEAARAEGATSALRQILAGGLTPEDVRRLAREALGVA